MSDRPRITVRDFAAAKTEGRRLCVLTAYDYPTAAALDACDVDALLVGDSLGMVVQGRENTLAVTLDQMIYHGEMVCRAARRALVVVDMPFPSFHLGRHAAIEAAARIVKETGCTAVKLEGGAAQADTIAALVGAGIPVMAHCGLQPQSVLQLGGYKVQREEGRLLADAQSAAAAGAFAIVLECISSAIAAKITRMLSIPTIGIGAGPDCDGQVLVTHDLLGLTSGYVPTFAARYADLQATVRTAATRFRDDVRGGVFPGPEQSFR